jgi:hypothetical protein
MVLAHTAPRSRRELCRKREQETDSDQRLGFVGLDQLRTQHQRNRPEIDHAAARHRKPQQLGGPIPGDAANKWKQGQAEVKAAGDRLYLLFDWDNGARRGLIDAQREGARLVGKYINLTDPKVTRPWIGLIVSNRRIDGRWTGGRLDFRR